MLLSHWCSFVCTGCTFINGRIGRLSPFTRDNQMFQMYENAWIQISYEGGLPIQRQRSGLLRTEPDGREIHQLDPSEESNSLTAQVPALLTPALRSSNEARNEQRKRLHNNSNSPPSFKTIRGDVLQGNNSLTYGTRSSLALWTVSQTISLSA